MEQTIDQNLTGKKSLPEMLKVLCILTFIGCAFTFVSAVYNYATIDKKIGEMETQMQKAQESGNATVIGMLQDAEDAVIKAQQNKIPIFIITILSGILCAVGAFMMWKLKKNGFFFYAIGELVPTIYSLIFIGIGKGIFGIITSVFGFVIPLVFIILYATQLKHME